MSDLSALETPLSVWKESLRAIRANFRPGLVLWTVAALLVGAYYFVPAAQSTFDVVAGWKAQGGFLYSFAATAVFGGLIPFLLMRILPATRADATGPVFVFMVVVWGYRGVEIDLLYRLQGLMFGNQVTLSVVAPKVAFDLFVYNVVWAAAFQLLTYHWKNHQFRASAFRGFPWKEFWTRRVPVALVSTWVVWFPVVTLVYCLPSNLQIPLFNLAACFWALVVGTLTKVR